MGVKLGQKWAIKDGNLLASNQVGSRFFNKEFDFSRASNGTYVDRDGLLKTAELYNLMRYSQDFGQWTLTNITREDNQIGYDGSNKAYKIIANGINNDKIRYSLTQISQQTFSAYVKKGNVNFTILEYQGFAYFDLENGLVGSTTAIESASIQDAGNGWYRCSITVTTTTNRTAQIYIAAANGSTSTSLGDYIYIQDAQVVEGTEPLDYQYTNGLQGLPRISFEDGVGHLLLEPQRSNLLLQSNQFDTTWNTINTTVTSGQNGIYGTNDAWLLSKSFSQARLFQNVTFNGLYTFSVYAKANDSNYIRLYFDNIAVSVYFSLIDGSLGSTYGSFVSATSEDIGNGWWRFAVVMNGVGTGARIYAAQADNDVTGSSGSIYIQHAQLESGSYPTSIIETTNTSVTRLADVCNNSGSAQDFNSEEGVLYAEIARGGDANDDYELISIMDSTDTIRVGFGKTNNSTDWYIRVIIGALSMNVSGYEFEEGFQKIAIKYKSGDSAVWLNGVEIETDTTAFSTALSFSELKFNWTGGNYSFYGKTRNLQVFTEALSDTQLISLTGGDSSSDGLLASYISRVEADGGTVEAQTCVKNELIELL